MVISLYSILLLYRGRVKELSIVGLSMIILGSLLPWWCVGDAAIFCAFGIDWYNVYVLNFWPTIGFFNSYVSLGNIGIAVIFLATLLTYLILSDQPRIKFHRMVQGLSSVLLVAFVLYQLVNHFVMRVSYLSVTSYVFLEDGLILITCGSLLLFVASLKDFNFEYAMQTFSRVAMLVIVALPFTHMLERFHYLYLR